MSFKIFLSGFCILFLSLGLHSFINQKDTTTPIPPAIPSLSDTYELPSLYFGLNNAYSEREEFKILNQRLNTFIKRWELKGASLAIVKDGKLVYARGFGYADQEEKVLAQPYHQFRIASISKLFTAVAIMKLVEKGKIRLEDKVFGAKGILNDSIYQNIADPLALKIEVHHLLKHTAGWRNQLRTDPMFSPLEVAQIMGVASPPSIETTIQFMLSQKGYFEPGTLYDYSNFGYCVAGEIIKKASGMDYNTYLQTQVLQPSGIKRMRLGKNKYAEKYPQEVRYYPHKKTENKLSAYGTGDSASKAYEATHLEALGPAGGWIATPTDLLRLVNAIDGFKTVPDILSPQSISQMTSITIESDSTQSQLMGWKGVDTEKWWRTGSLVGTSAVLVRQHNGISWAFLTNTDTWRGPYFSYEVEAEIRRILASIKHFPRWDLFLLEEY
jgi:CubicO group peptidase (beta-lactamase class C family)